LSCVTLLEQAVQLFDLADSYLDGYSFPVSFAWRSLADKFSSLLINPRKPWVYRRTPLPPFRLGWALVTNKSNMYLKITPVLPLPAFFLLGYSPAAFDWSGPRLYHPQERSDFLAYWLMFFFFFFFFPSSPRNRTRPSP